MKHKPVVTRKHPAGMGGYQKIYRFENGFGASLVEFPGSYGLEMAVIKFTGPDVDSFELRYDTPITNDVIGHLTPQSAETTLEMISKLPAEATA